MLEGLDCSHWNLITNWQKMVDAGIKWVYIKFSQGMAYKDPKAVEHYTNAKKVGLKIGAYHFVTKDNAIKQYDWFLSCIKDYSFDLAPVLDCEAYTDYYSDYNLYSIGIEEEVFPIKELRYGSIDQKAVLELSDILGYSYPTEAIVDVIGNRLNGFQGFGYPAIYTNYSSGNVIFKSSVMKKYPLYIANWNVAKPLLPTVWKNELYYIWQDKVVPGAPYGVEGKVDHNVWGSKIPFPDVTPPTEKEIIAKAVVNGETYSGVLKKEN